MQPSKAFLGLILVLLVAVASSVEATVEHKKETEYCRNARKECQEKCQDMIMVGAKSLVGSEEEFGSEKELSPLHFGNVKKK
jgi:hypothetical protein